MACENTKQGSPSTEWDKISGGGQTIEGYAAEFSVNAGETVHFKVNTPARSYSIDIYRMGYYGGDGARKIASITPSASLPQSQPSCLSDDATGLIDCGDWKVSASWPVPATAVSGIYFAHISRTDGTDDDNHIVFVVRNDASHSDVVFKTSDTTWQAYNSWGGNSLYAGDSTAAPGRAVKVSYNRPFNTRESTPWGRDFVFANEYPMVRFLEAQGYDVTYLSSVDADQRGSLLKNHKVFLSVGHDEYWSAAERANVEAARDTGVNLGFFSGNSVFWKTRWEPSADGTSTPYRTLVTYKSTRDNRQTDPTGTWTGSWRDPRFSPPADGGRPENGLMGTIWTVNCCGVAMKVPAADGKMRFWRNTPAGSQSSGATLTMPDLTLGYEWDEDLDNGFRPAGLIDMSSTTADIPEKLVDFGTNVAPGTATHHLTLYRAPSGALVFGGGTVQWSWGLDAVHDGPDGAPTAPDPSMRQATINLLADMNVQPLTPQSDLKAATASTDHTAPTSTVTSPAADASITNGKTVTISGTASDVGGQVGGVEVSTDGGTTWHPATGRATWTYSWDATGAGPVTIRTRATDDSGNIETPGSGRTVNVSCPCGLFGQSAVPANPAESDATPLEAGVKFRASVDGWVTGVRFYKGTGNTGTHTGSLWTADGTHLATATFANETSTGWQSVSFPVPVHVTAGTTYVASYFAPAGHYAADAAYFAYRPTNSPPLTGLQAGTDGGNGVYHAGGAGFPTDTYNGGNYWVDVAFATVEPPDTTAPAVIDSTPYAGSSSVPTAVLPSVTFGEPVRTGSASFTLKDSGGTAVAGSASLDSAGTGLTFLPTGPLPGGTTFTATVTGAKDAAGNTMTSFSYSFTTAKPRPAAGQCPCSIWADDTVPSVEGMNDPNALELGVKFTPDTNGFVSGIRFYKGRNNTGTHTGTLWTAGGTQLATATFSSESTLGWQEVRFSSPVAVTAGTTYVASYHTATGWFSADSGGLSRAVDDPPLHTIADGADGVFAYGAHAFPSQSYNTSNYWVDVVFTLPPDTTPPAVASTNPSNNATSVPAGATVKVAFNEAVQPSSPAFTLKNPGGTAIAGSTAFDSASRVLTFTPSSPLAVGTKYTASVSGAKDTAGNAMQGTTTWSFTTSGSCPCTLFPSDAAPVTAAAGDSGSVELGVEFTPDTAGWISGVRFYKGAGNTGTHTGSLWTTGGTRLATGTFSGETASGWQTLAFSGPVQVTAGTTYVASYHAPNGHYAADGGYFWNALDNAPLHAPTSAASGGNGRYAYASGTRFPNESYGASNYWVDPIFSTAQPGDVTPPTVETANPVGGQTSVPPGTGISAAFDEAVQGGTVQFTVTPSVTGSVTYDSATRTATFQPSAALAWNTAYTVKVTGAKDVAGNTMAAAYTWSFTTARQPATPGVCPCSIWADSAIPQVTGVDDPNSVELGVRFTSDTAGWVTGVRFYKGPANTGTHTGTLWTADGTRLATVTFSGESAAGWQEARFSTAISVSANTTYVVSYLAPNGHYAADSSAFSGAGVDAPPLHALRSGGLYGYGAGGFPTNASTANYWVDVVFTTTAPATALLAGGPKNSPSPTPTPTPSTPPSTTPREGEHR
ncbi:DUF4082 domain-containing protein [Actinoallomurus purpureus]|uniref:DUF4082 domain-containing protein n=1 Tax=Actinoallomurus purpureus TaxID=478114 RepID=UPI002093E0E0|nr:DUF4082 domain-containing protein [Actinoallomurus purpureus]MCO6009530.1 DUF4082 domain-containing protein [Actinoallomurus purpureus]